MRRHDELIRGCLSSTDFCRSKSGDYSGFTGAAYEMSLKTAKDIWKQERIGLNMILASLLVIMATLYLLFSHQLREQKVHITEDGTSLARVLSRVPYDRLVMSSGYNDILSVIQHSQQHADIAYLAVVDINGQVKAEITGPGVLLPAADVPVDPTTWLGQRSLQLPGTDKMIEEFHAPLLANGQIAGYVRLGYNRPAFGLQADQIPFFATFALPIFLLTPLFYFLLRREVRPFQEATEKLDSLVSNSGGPGNAELSVSNELQDFMGRFNSYISATLDRIGTLEADRNELMTSTKLLGYKRKRMESVLFSFPDAVMVLDESGATSMVNTRLANLLGVSKEDMIGRKPSEWSVNADFIAFLAGSSAGGMSGYRNDSIEYTPPGQPDKQFLLTHYPLFSPKDASQILGTLVIFRDVTAEKIARDSGNAFVAHLAHELKSPLNVLSMYSDALLGDAIDDEALRVEAANVISDEVERLGLLISNMLSITRIEMGSMSIERKRVKLRDLLQDAFDACRRGGKEKNIQFSLDLPREISPVALDKDLMRVAINNLLTNAIKYSDPEGSVSMSIEEADLTVRISIRDNGIGIAPDEQDRIFEKFYRSESDDVRSRTGHGLGLSLAREIIQLHHGTLTVKSAVGEGSEFTVEFNKETNLLKKAV